MYAYELAKPLKAQGLIQVDGEDDEYIRVKERGICEGRGGICSFKRSSIGRICEMEEAGQCR
jgi:hypothetical protein